MSKIKKNIGYIIGIIFLASAISKLISIELFEQFIYSLKIVPLNTSIILARLVVAFELTIGLFYLLKIKQQLTSLFTLASLIIFTLFIITIEFYGISDDCHCFGSALQLSNKASILKNIILIAFVLISDRKYETKKFTLHKVVFALTLSTIISFAHHFPLHLVGINSEIEYCEPCLNKFIKQEKIENESKIICFISTKCKYCKLAAQKISIINSKANKPDKILYVLWDDNHNASLFFNETKSTAFNNVEMDVLSFLKLTQGQMPLIIVLKQGKIIQTFRYQDINEDYLLNYLSKI